MNLLPLNSKLCSFDCIYCECGLTKAGTSTKGRLFTSEEIKIALDSRLKMMTESSVTPDNITFAGNGEPTLHPEFESVINNTVELRDKYFPAAKITVLSNGTFLHREAVSRSLAKIDNNVLKLDAGTNNIFRLINRPQSAVTLDEIVERYSLFKGKIIVQTLFVRGVVEGVSIDNTTPSELEAWILHLKKINPDSVMIYPIARRTPYSSLRSPDRAELEKIAEKVAATGLKVEVFD